MTQSGHTKWLYEAIGIGEGVDFRISTQREDG
jgi:hypothetical protein